ncbi:MAG: YciI family protein [Candidatus Dormiibacterota bacterium]
MLLFIRDEEAVLDEAALAAQHAAVDRWFGELGPTGKLLGGEELQPSRTATTIRWQEGRPLVTDGPFMESKENVAGFVTIEAADLDDAIAIAKTWPPQDQLVEIRPVISHGDDMPNHPVG